MAKFQEHLNLFLARPGTDKFILVLIAINAVTLGLETSATVMERTGGLLALIDGLILTIFVVELIARMVADFRGFWRDPWRIFDFLVVSIALIPATGPLAVLRAFRILRVLLLLVLILYVFAVISTKLFGTSFPEWFGSIGKSSYTLFQIMTLESWSMGIVRPVMEDFPYAWALFVPFIIATAFTVLNLFIGVIVDAMQSEHAEEAHAERDAMKHETELILREVRELRQELAEIRKTG